MDAELKNAPTLKEIREQNTANILRSLLRTRELVRGAVAGERFRELFFAGCKDQAIADYVKSLL